MKALVISFQDTQHEVKLYEKDRPEADPGSCLVKLNAAALNRRDYWISIGKYPGIRDGATLGADGCGEVIAGDEAWRRKKVLINPNVNWGDNPVHQSADYAILGNPTDGTLAEYVVVPTDRLVEKPDYLSDEEAAAFPLAGLTAYRACFTRARVRAGDNVLITGIGGGVAQFAFAFCLAAGATVYVTSSSRKKIDRMVTQGAQGGFDYTEVGWAKRAKSSAGLFDAIIDSAGGDALNEYLRIIRPGGKLVLYGSTTGKGSGLDLHRLFWSQAAILGSTMGNDDEFREMVAFIAKHEIKPVIHKVYKLADAVKAIRSMTDPGHFGKTIIKI